MRHQLAYVHANNSYSVVQWLISFWLDWFVSFALVPDTCDLLVGCVEQFVNSSGYLMVWLVTLLVDSLPLKCVTACRCVERELHDYAPVIASMQAYKHAPKQLLVLCA